MSGLIEVAREAADAIENLARRTLDPGEIPAPDLGAVVAELSAMSRQLPQVLDQIGRGLEAREPMLRLDANGDARYPTPGSAVGVARLAMAEAIEAANALARALDEAHQITSTIGERFDDEDD